jgi:hypothetical protein
LSADARFFSWETLRPRRWCFAVLGQRQGGPQNFPEKSCWFFQGARGRAPSPASPKNGVVLLSGAQFSILYTVWNIGTQFSILYTFM